MPSEQEGKKDFIQGIHYYLEGERVIFTSLFHVERGQCCGNSCRHCPYEPKRTIIVEEKFVLVRTK